jgi:hypothetical protein
MKTSKSIIAGKVLTSIFVIFMLSCVTLLSSCTATLRTPRHVSTEVVIQGRTGVIHDNNRDRHERRERRNERRGHHDND